MDIRRTARKAAGFLAAALAARALAGTPAQAQTPWTARDVLADGLRGDLAKPARL